LIGEEGGELKQGWVGMGFVSWRPSDGLYSQEVWGLGTLK